MNSEISIIPRPDFNERCLKFSASILCLIEQMPKSAVARTIADQLSRSGMSMGANAHEARSAESRADFIHKFQIALKEARETAYWLGLLHESGLLKDPVLPLLRNECDQITAILVASIKTARKNDESQAPRKGI